jgi:hypothetical protein
VEVYVTSFKLIQFNRNENMLATTQLPNKKFTIEKKKNNIDGNNTRNGAIINKKQKRNE